MVGDNWEHDVEAAEFLGMTGVLVTMDLDETPQKDGYQIDTFSQLLDIVSELNAEPLDGVIKYTLNHRPTEIKIPDTRYSQLIALRDKLWSLNLIGVYPENYYMTPGVGFGNASMRYTDDHQFLVSGSQTGEKSTTTKEDYALVLDFNIDENLLISKGPCKPSSESLTHAAVYEVAPEVKVVIHVHHKGMWEAFDRFHMPTTPEDVLYGTPEMARAIQEVYHQHPKLQRPVCMRGHIEGLLTWGETVEEALELYLEVLSEMQ